MSASSAIEWTDATWNPVTGCDKVSPGCAHCYAETFAERWRGTPGHPFEQGFDLKLWPERLDLPLRWRKPRMVFVNSMSDLFHEDIPDEFIARVFATMASASSHTFQVLTKRPERMREWMNRVAICEHGWLTHDGTNPARAYDGTGVVIPNHNGWPLPNVWLGVSIENRRFVHRADVLRDTPAAVRFISAEPLLGPLVPDIVYQDGTMCWEFDRADERAAASPYLKLDGIDWLIVGGESGPGHRPIREQWVKNLRNAAGATGTAFFFKQWGGARPRSGGRELDGRTYDEMPPTRPVAA